MRRTPSGYLGEGAVILSSILMAFALESGWEGRRDRRAFSLELSNVLDEFQSNLAEMEAWLAAHRRAAASAAAMVEVLLERESDLLTITDTLAIGPLLYPTVDPSLGGLRTLLQSGRLAFIEDAELRLALASWEDLLEDLREEELTGKEVTVARLWPVLLFGQPPGVTRRLVDLHDYFWRDPARTSPLPSGAISLRVTDELVSVLMVKHSAARQTVDEFEPIVALARDVIERIGVEFAS